MFYASLHNKIKLLLFKIFFFWYEHTLNSIRKRGYEQGLVKGAVLCFRNPYFYFQHGESTSTASQLTSPASQKSKDLNKVLLPLQDLALVSENSPNLVEN